MIYRLERGDSRIKTLPFKSVSPDNSSLSVCRWSPGKTHPPSKFENKATNMNLNRSFRGSGNVFT